MSGKTCNPKNHEWVVFSTALQDVCLMLQCLNCGMHGTVDDPTKEEWREAFHAPSNPYRWRDNSRVTIRGQGAVYVEHPPSAKN